MLGLKSVARGLLTAAVMVILPPVHADTIFSDLDSTSTPGGYVVGQYSPGNSFVIGAGFTPGKNDTFGQFRGLLSFSSGDNHMVITLYEDSGGVPGPQLESWDLNNVLGAAPAIVTLPSVKHPLLLAGHQYWITAGMTSATSTGTWWINNVGLQGMATGSLNGGPFTPAVLTSYGFHAFAISSATGTPQVTPSPLVGPNTPGVFFSGTVVITGSNFQGAFLTVEGPLVLLGSATVNAAGTQIFQPYSIGCCAPFEGQTFTFSVHTSGGITSFQDSITLSSVPPPGSPIPVFPITVTSNITATSATATAQIQPPAQVVGTVASVYVFAHARLSTLKSAASDKRAQLVPVEPLDGPAPDPCVLAQLNSNGQLTGANASTLSAYTTGVIDSQGQSVAILNNVSTPNVAGASFFVGYGSTSSGMFTSGLYEGAVSVQGTSGCSAALLTGAAPNAPNAVSGLWWNANESGWGIHFTQRAGNTFAAWYTYDALGKPKWYVATCAGFTGLAGTCTGTLYEVTGPNFFGAAFDPSLVHATNAGSLQATFSNANSASMTFTAAGQTRTIALTRQPLATGTTPPAVDYTDLWWNPGESGWGMAMSQQYGITFLAWYVYDASGKPTWQVATCTMSGSSCTGTLYRTTGPAFGPTFNANLVQATSAGTVAVSFTDANNAIVNYTVDGVSGSKTITRQLF